MRVVCRGSRRGEPTLCRVGQDVRIPPTFAAAPAKMSHKFAADLFAPHFRPAASASFAAVSALTSWTCAGKIFATAANEFSRSKPPSLVM